VGGQATINTAELNSYSEEMYGGLRGSVTRKVRRYYIYILRRLGIPWTPCQPVDDRSAEDGNYSALCLFFNQRLLVGSVWA